MIPRPVGPISRRVITTDSGGECLARQMGLMGSENDRRTYYSILNTVGKLCDRYFPHDREMPVGRDAKRPLYDEALRRQPILKMYEDAWPISTMLGMHRQARRAGCRGIIVPFPETPTIRAGSCPAVGKTSGRFKPAGVAGGSTRPGTVFVALSSRRPAGATGTTHSVKKRRGVSLPRRNRSRSRSRSASIGSTVTLSSQPSRARPSKARAHSQRARNDASAASAQHTTHAPVAHSSAANAKVAAGVGKSSQVMETFLRALPQDLGDLLPVFIQYGVDDDDALRGMLRMPAWQSWLYSWVKEGWLTELQFRMICNGLAQIALG